MIRQDCWQPSGGLELEPNADRSVRAEQGCIALLAGPGAGKSETLAQRADFLLRTSVCAYPKRILAISFKKDASENLKERVSKRCGKDLSSRFDSYTFHAFAKRLIDIFRTSLIGQDALDEDYTVGENRIPRTQITFADMVPFANEILRACPLARNSILTSYCDVFLDEFQDCTDAQYSLVVSAFRGSGARIIAVGDTKQKIMGWAGALEGIFLKFGEDFGATSLNLYQNFRSLHRIRRVHNRMVTDIDPQAAVPGEQIDREEGEVACISLKDDAAEAEWIADSIEQWHLEGIAYSQFAILCNTQPHLYAQKIMTALDQRGIPFRNEQQDQDLCSEPLCCLVVDYLLILLGDVEPDAWERFRRILDQDWSEADTDAKGRDWDIFIRSNKAVVRSKPDAETACLVVGKMLDKLGMESLRGLSHDYENQARVKELLGNIREHVVTSFSGAAEPVRHLKSIGSTEAVRILTIHKCKGLEFHTVIVQGVESETFFGTKQDSECAFFVAISRAMERLVTTVVGHREKLPGANWRWQETRTAHRQFLSYVEPEIGGF